MRRLEIVKLGSRSPNMQRRGLAHQTEFGVNVGFFLGIGESVP